jgi:hypothetical protein
MHTFNALDSRSLTADASGAKKATKNVRNANDLMLASRRSRSMEVRRSDGSDQPTEKKESEQGQSMTASVRAVLQSTTLPAAGCGKSVSGREGEREYGGHSGTGDKFQMTPDVAAINAFVRVVAVVVDSREAGHCSVIGVCRGSGSSQSG